MAILRDREITATLEGGFSGYRYLKIEMNLNTGEVKINATNKTPPIEPQVTTEEKGVAGIKLGNAFSRAFGVLADNKAVSGNDTPEVVNIALGKLKEITKEYLASPHTTKQLAFFVGRESIELAGLARFENLPKAYVQPILEQLKGVMHDAMLEYFNIPRS